MAVFQIIALLLTFSAFGAYVNKRFLKLPATIGVMVCALLMSVGATLLGHLGLVNVESVRSFVSQIDFSGVFLHGMLSFLLFAGALHVNLHDLRKYRVIVTLLATVGVLIATLVTGTLVWWGAAALGFTFPILYALLFGSLIAPTDPVAVLGILKTTNLSRNFQTKIGCESLLNDGVAVVVFMVLAALIVVPEGMTLEPWHVLAFLIWSGGGGIVLGLTLGWITYRLLRPIDDYKVEVLLTLALAAGGYSLAELVQLSAPLTMVVAGLVIGNHGRTFGMSQKTRAHLDLFWELLDEILNAVLFMLIGLEMMVLSLTEQHMIMGLVAIGAMLVGRFVSVALPVYLMHFRHRFETGTIPLLTWGGLRGGISIAMALSLPSSPMKEDILAMTYLVVVFSVLLQGTTFQHLALFIGGKPSAPR